MKPKEQSKTYWVFRLFKPGREGEQYAYNCKRWANRAEWALTDLFMQAERYHNRSDARRILKSAVVKSHLKYHEDWFWEVVKVVETISTTYEVEVVCGDAPAMVQIARAAR